MKANVIIRMGAAYFDARVRAGQHIVHYDLRKLPKREVHNFRRALVKACEDAGIANRH